MGSDCVVVVIVAALANVAATWRDPIVMVELALTANRTTPYTVGEAVQFTCEAQHMPLPTATLYFGHQRGDREHRLLPGGRSALSRSHVVTQHDAGTALACDSGYSDLDQDGRPHYYTVRAPPIQFAINGVPPTTPAPPSAASPSIAMSSNVTSTTHHAGDFVQFTCRATNMQHAFIEVRQAKGNLETALSVGYQLTRVLTLRLAAADHATSVFCQAWLTDSGQAYHINSNRVPISMH